jgi:acyl-CoA hydrolase
LAPVPAAASQIRLARIMDALDVNLYGNVHGGVIMKMVDDAAGAAAARHSGGAAVTVAMDEMVFLVSVHVGDLVTCEAQVNWTGRTSMEVGVRVTAEPWDRSSRRITWLRRIWRSSASTSTNARARCPPSCPERKSRSAASTRRRSGTTTASPGAPQSRRRVAANDHVSVAACAFTRRTRHVWAQRATDT